MPTPTQTRQPLPHLREWRVWNGYSQADLAKLAGTAKSTVVKLETGATTANFATLGKLADALGISRQQLLHRAPTPDDLTAPARKPTRASRSASSSSRAKTLAQTETADGADAKE